LQARSSLDVRDDSIEVVVETADVVSSTGFRMELVWEQAFE